MTLFLKAAMASTLGTIHPKPKVSGRISPQLTIIRWEVPIINRSQQEASKIHLETSVASFLGCII
jgi:hypothetical protein